MPIATTYAKAQRIAAHTHGSGDTEYEYLIEFVIEPDMTYSVVVLRDDKFIKIVADLPDYANAELCYLMHIDMVIDGEIV